MDEPSEKLQNLKSLNSLLAAAAVAGAGQGPPAAGGVVGAGQGRFGVRGRFGWTKKRERKMKW
ncbi:hypothetical protein C1H46_022544 [Malus baccata]|uniref:Uncharacterized protein n=1 Tax=Malus baccata TaxID=106549 RepID=A0A540LZM0_MALBA|nr:hypothetical protein C1H46_022544 [Malus baccata]